MEPKVTNLKSDIWFTTWRVQRINFVHSQCKVWRFLWTKDKINFIVFYCILQNHPCGSVSVDTENKNKTSPPTFFFFIFLSYVNKLGQNKRLFLYQGIPSSVDFVEFRFFLISKGDTEQSRELQRVVLLIPHRRQQLQTQQDGLLGADLSSGASFRNSKISSCKFEE